MKKLITLLLVLVMALSLAACGGNQTADDSEEPQATEPTTEAAETTEENGNTEIEYDEPIIIMDNEYCKMVVTSKFCNHDVYDFGNNEKSKTQVGYRLLIENKDPEKYLRYVMESTVIDGYTLAMSDYPNFAMGRIAPGTKGRETITFFDRDNGSVRFSSMAELADVDVLWELSFSDDNTTWYGIYDTVLVKSENPLP